MIDAIQGTDNTRKELYGNVSGGNWTYHILSSLVLDWNEINGKISDDINFSFRLASGAEVRISGVPEAYLPIEVSVGGETLVSILKGKYELTPKPAPEPEPETGSRSMRR